MKRKKFCSLIALLCALVLSISWHTNIVHAEEPMTFNYTGNVQEVTLEPGSYLFEVYGAKGGNGMRNSGVVTNTGYGGYSRGEISLTETTTFYIYVGGSGQDALASSYTMALGGFNGGGNGGRDTDDDDAPGGGGGASDIRLVGGPWNESASLRSRIIVAGGASGATREGVGQSGGNTNSARNANQTSGYAFGIGSNGIDATGAPGSGAGGGYYGGNTPVRIATSSTRPFYSEGGAGSSFISGHPGCNAMLENGTHSNQSIHYSGMYFTNTYMQDGVQNGTGLVRITPLFPDLSVLLEINEIAQLSVTHNLPDNTTLTWTSTNQNAVIVDGNGVVTAVGEGTSFIWATNADGTFRESIPIRVLRGAAEMRLSLHLKTGETKRLWYGNDPSIVTWQAMDPSVATIDANGQVTGISQGLCIVKAELDGVEKYIYVRVNEINE